MDFLPVSPVLMDDSFKKRPPPSLEMVIEFLKDSAYINNEDITKCNTSHRDIEFLRKRHNIVDLEVSWRIVSRFERNRRKAIIRYLTRQMEFAKKKPAGFLIEWPSLDFSNYSQQSYTDGRPTKDIFKAFYDDVISDEIVQIELNEIQAGDIDDKRGDSATLDKDTTLMVQNTELDKVNESFAEENYCVNADISMYEKAGQHTPNNSEVSVSSSSSSSTLTDITEQVLLPCDTRPLLMPTERHRELGDTSTRYSDSNVSMISVDDKIIPSSGKTHAFVNKYLRDSGICISFSDQHVPTIHSTSKLSTSDMKDITYQLKGSTLRPAKNNHMSTEDSKVKTVKRANPVTKLPGNASRRRPKNYENLKLQLDLLKRIIQKVEDVAEDHLRGIENDCLDQSTVVVNDANDLLDKMIESLAKPLNGKPVIEKTAPTSNNKNPATTLPVKTTIHPFIESFAEPLNVKPVIGKPIETYNNKSSFTTGPTKNKLSHDFILQSVDRSDQVASNQQSRGQFECRHASGDASGDFKDVNTGSQKKSEYQKLDIDISKLLGGDNDDTCVADSEACTSISDTNVIRDGNNGFQQQNTKYNRAKQGNTEIFPGKPTKSSKLRADFYKNSMKDSKVMTMPIIEHQSKDNAGNSSAFPKRVHQSPTNNYIQFQPDSLSVSRPTKASILREKFIKVSMPPKPPSTRNQPSESRMKPVIKSPGNMQATEKPVPLKKLTNLKGKAIPLLPNKLKPMFKV